MAITNLTIRYQRSRDADYARSGLIADSLIRLGYLAVVPHSKLLGSIGSISPERYRRLIINLSDYLRTGITPDPDIA